MKNYRKLKTTMGRTYWVRMDEDEIAERSCFRTAVVVLPFIASVLMTAVWLAR